MSDNPTSSTSQDGKRKEEASSLKKMKRVRAFEIIIAADTQTAQPLKLSITAGTRSNVKPAATAGAEDNVVGVEVDVTEAEGNAAGVEADVVEVDVTDADVAGAEGNAAGAEGNAAEVEAHIVRVEVDVDEDDVAGAEGNAAGAQGSAVEDNAAKGIANNAVHDGMYPTLEELHRMLTED